MTRLGEFSVTRCFCTLYEFHGTVRDGSNGFEDTELSFMSHFNLRKMLSKKTWILNPVTDNITNFSNLRSHSVLISKFYKS